MATQADRAVVSGRWGRIVLGVGILAALLAIVAAVLDLPLFLHAYLTAYFFWLAIALGCLVVLMIQNLTGGLWGAVIRRVLEAAAGTLPLLAVLFLPILIGSPALYAWTQPGGIGQPTLPGFKQVYLTLPFFVVRAIVYFAAWIIMTRLLVRWSRQRDEEPDPSLTLRLRGLSAVGLIIMALTITFAAVDWLMSLDATWFSSIFGAMVAMGALLTGLAFATALLALWARREPFAQVVTPDLFNSLGSLMLAFLMLWAYLAFSQFILIYAGNLTEEITWYVRRSTGGWLLLAILVAVGHFVVPFAFLILRGAKRNRRVLGLVAAWLVVAHYANLYWIVQPAFPNDSPMVAVYNLVIAVAIGGLWLALLARQMTAAPLLARNDPELLAGLEVAHE